MLHRFLETIWQGDVQSLAEIAHRLDVSQGMVFQIAKELTKKGYLQEIGSDCNETHEGCPDCPVTSTCQTLTKHWFLTEKGRAAVIGK